MTTLIETEQSFLKLYSFEEHNDLIQNCIKEINKLKLLEEKPIIIVYGREVHQPRDVVFLSNESIGYKFSKVLTKSKPLSPNVTILLQEINTYFNADYNGILINRYNDGDDCIGKHSDAETSLGNIGVISLSSGAERKFRIRNKITNKIIMDVPTTNNCILHMGGNFQKEFTHEIPKEKKVNTVRYAFTFRKHLI